MVGKLTTFGFGSIVMLICVLFPAQQLNAVSPACNDEPMRIIYVRGSGEVYGGNIFESLQANLNKNLIGSTYQLHELKPDLLVSQEAEEYQAISILGSISENTTGTVALLTAGEFGKYSKSVDSGVDLLATYFAETGSCTILIGYSQGAHVIGDFLEINRNDLGLLSKIKYVGLIGDPKLDLDGIDFIPGKNVPWYRGTAIPLIQGGILGNRKPYMPNGNNQLLLPVSSWCFNDDVVCSSNFVAAGTNAHAMYPDRAIPQMAIEIASIINNPTGTVTKDLYAAETCGPAKQDIVVLVDTSPLMRREVSIFTDSPMFYGSEAGKPLPTAGQMILQSGCGDTRLAVVGYGRAQDGPPRLLLDFTKNPADYDSLMKSLYQPNSTGQYERTQLREGALTALDSSWRQGAAKTVIAITDIAGSGNAGSNAWRGWDDQLAQTTYLRDSLSQSLFTKIREKDAVLLGIPVLHSFGGFSRVAGDEAATEVYSYLKMIVSSTGGYFWPRVVPNYSTYNFKFTRLDTTINHVMQMREKTVANIAPAKGRVGVPITLRVTDPISLATAATMRNDSVQYKWHLDCDDKSKFLYEFGQTITFTPDKAQTCVGSVIMSVRQRTGAGCYSNCPEPFPPYLYKSLPIVIDIKPSNYVPKVPAKITTLQKTIYSHKVEYSWDEPAYNGDEKIVYILREPDGTVLAITTERAAVIEDTGGSDHEITLGAAGLDGQSVIVSSSTASTLDLRPIELPPEPEPESEPVVQVPTEPHAEEPDSENGVEVLIPDPSGQLVDSEVPPVVLPSSQLAEPSEENENDQVLALLGSDISGAQGEVLADTASAVTSNTSNPQAIYDVVAEKQGSTWLLTVLIGTGVLILITLLFKFLKPTKNI